MSRSARLILVFTLHNVSGGSVNDHQQCFIMIILFHTFISCDFYFDIMLYAGGVNISTHTLTLALYLVQ